jgi:hypothetical protein
MAEFTEQEQAELDEAVLEDCPPGYVVPTMERDSRGRLLPGHPGLKKAKPKPISDTQLKRLAKQEITFLTHHEEVALKREAIHSVIGEHEMRKAILDLYNAALAAENPYAKVALWREFFLQTVGNPPQQKQVDIQQTSFQVKQQIDYSQLTVDELKALEAVAVKVLPNDGQQ